MKGRVGIKYTPSLVIRNSDVNLRLLGYMPLDAGCGLLPATRLVLDSSVRVIDDICRARQGR